MEAGTRARPARRTAPSKGAIPTGNPRGSSAITAPGASTHAPQPGHSSRDADRPGHGTHEAPRPAGTAPTATQGGMGALRHWSKGSRRGSGAQASGAREPCNPRARRQDPAAAGSGRTTVSASPATPPGNGLQACRFY
ncbi:hypothetical protein NDU88_003432 [Pleurodeles waltl]|uniref:Uncharacterized protein n=1 Tax=Pleurodeles waltl TaxID=8319 RepID=A0AAV7QBQ3_PLEWA|nr:hypothetical protein NDU88_003432 [Pleurodeles waltl]